MTDQKTGTQPGLANLHLIGGEMMAWSDYDTGRGRPPVRGEVFGPALTALVRPGARVLVAGPHDLALIELVVRARAEVVCLLRSLSDAQALARRYAAEKRVSVLCGGLEKLGPAETFDAIVALDSLDRLSSVEGADVAWGEAFDLLLDALRPDGSMLLAVENFLGLHRLVDLPPAYADSSDAAWTPTGEFDLTRPAGLDATLSKLRTSALDVETVYAAYPTPSAPTVLLTREALDGDAALHGYLDGTVAAACAKGYAGRAVLSDPRRLASTALRQSAGTALAPMWVLLARRAGSSPLVGHGTAALPAIVVADGTVGEPWHVLYEIDPGPGGEWTRRLLEPAAAASQSTVDRFGSATPAVRRVPAALEGPVPAGRTLEERLLSSCLKRDLPGLRERLTSYHSWLTGQEVGGVLPERFAFATVENVVVTADDGFELLDPSWHASRPLPTDVALVRSLRRFAVSLLVGGFAHPWPSTLDANALTVMLAAMAGLNVDRSVVERAVSAEVELESAIRGLSQHQRMRFAQDIAVVATGSRSSDVRSYRELHESAVRLESALAQAESKIVWYEEMLVHRETALKYARRTINMLSNSLTYKVGHAIIAPVKWAKRMVKGVLKRVRGGDGRG
jgi:hypothetical protein